MAPASIWKLKTLGDGARVEAVEWFDKLADKVLHQVEVTNPERTAMFGMPSQVRNGTRELVDQIFAGITPGHTFRQISDELWQ